MTQMTTHSDTINNLYAAFVAGDVPAVLASFAPTISWTEAEGFPYGGTYKATGKSFGAPFVHVWRLSGDKIISFRQHTETAVVQRALQ
jgi:uncharacterized protein